VDRFELFHAKKLESENKSQETRRLYLTMQPIWEEAVLFFCLMSWVLCLATTKIMVVPNVKPNQKKTDAPLESNCNKNNVRESLEMTK
jgi:hypothetical protein